MEVIRQSLAIAFVFALLALALWLLRKRTGMPFSRSSATGSMESRGRIVLTAQHSLHLIRIGERDLVLAVHPSGITVLTETGLSLHAQLSTRGK